MIVSEIRGGLGNQMFQYACGRGVSLKKNTDFQLDISWFNRDTRPYALNCFNIHEEICKNKVINELREKGRFYRMKHRFIHDFHVVREREKHFQNRVFSLKGNLYLQGDWQTERYFSDAAETIRKDFSLREPLSPKSETIADQILNEKNAVSIHVRRGDYLTIAANKNLFCEMPITYYEQCIRFLQERYTDLSVYVFSNDIPWVKQNLNLAVPVYFIDHNDENHGYEDMILMSFCRHNITANSTFSWWGAWLNQHADKQVFTPGKWFRKQGYMNEDLIPNQWIKSYDSEGAIVFDLGCEG